jgi:4-amino-4-deoxy-L-arabinose transferase-like glycosyltransferase
MLVFLLATLASVVVLGFGAWRGSINSADDAVFAISAREMLASGNWLFPTLDDVPVLSRPPGSIWAIAASVGLLGESEFALRLPAVLAHAITAGFTATIARTTAGRSGAVVATAILLASTLFFSLARAVMSDHLMMMGMAAAACGAFVRNARPGVRIALLGLGFGLSLMAKQVVPFVICSVPMIAALQEGRPARFAAAGILRITLALLLAAAVLLPWHLAAWAHHGDRFVAEFLVRNVVDRASTSILSSTDALYYVRLAFHEEALLASLAVLALAKGVSATWRDPSLVWWVLWTASIVLPFSIASTRLPHYMLPAVVPMALMVTTLLYGVGRRDLLAGALLAAAALVGVATNATDALHPDYSPDERHFGLWARENAPGYRVASFEHYGQSVFWYADQPLWFLTVQPAAFEAMNTERTLADRGAVQLVDQAALRTLLHTQAICLQHPAAWTPQLKSLAQPESVVIEGLYTNLLCNRLP